MNIDLGKLILRLGFGALMIPHGTSKLIKLFENGFQVNFADPLGVGPFPTLLTAIIAEVICPVLVVLGIKTRIATIPVILTMAVAAFIVHAGDPWGDKEMAILYLIGYTSIALIGSGGYAVNKNS